MNESQGGVLPFNMTVHWSLEHEHRRLLERNVPEFIPPTLCPPNFPGLKPVDFKASGVQVYCRRKLTDSEYRE